LPVDGIRLVDRKGETFLMTDNGHYVVRGGTIIDVWNNFELKSTKDVQRSKRAPLKKMGFDTQRFGLVPLSSDSAGKQEVLVWMDPSVDSVSQFVPKLVGMTAKYSVQIIVVTSEGTSPALARAMICDPEQTKNHLLGKGRLPTFSDSSRCGEEKLELNLAFAKILAVRKLPTVMAPNGAMMLGVSDHYQEFLSKNLE
jgi:hypothetical protein